MNDLPLFDNVATAPPIKETRQAKRMRKAHQAYLATSDAWKAATYRLAVEEFLPAHAEFIFEEFTLLYREETKTRGLPETVDARAFAGILFRLKKEKLVGKVIGETRLRTNCSPSQLYRSLIIH